MRSLYRFSLSSMFTYNTVTKLYLTNRCLEIFFISLSFRIIGLGGNSRKIFGFKGLIGKIFRNNDLAATLPLLLEGRRGLTPGDRLRFQVVKER